MFAEILVLLISTLAKLYTMVVLLRLLMQLARADFYNPLSQFIVKATDPLLKPLRRVIPGLWGVDFPSIVLAMLVQLASIILLDFIGGANFEPLFTIIRAVYGTIYVALDLAFFSIMIVIIVSWVAPQSYNPAVTLLRQITEPIMAPFRKIIPPMGGFDFSPMLAIFVIYVLQTIVMPRLLMVLLS